MFDDRSFLEGGEEDCRHGHHDCDDRGDFLSACSSVDYDDGVGLSQYALIGFGHSFFVNCGLIVGF